MAGPTTTSDADAPEPLKRSFNERLRDRYFGRRHEGETAAEEAVAESSLPKSNQMGFFGRVERPGGFDAPPEEPVELEGPLPWELGGEKAPATDERDEREGRDERVDRDERDERDER